MEITGIICEYNPLHRGHRHQFQKIREEVGEDSGIVCLMSGNFVQRGAPAIVDKSLRAAAAVSCGADLVLELPVTYALSSAEGFAAGGVEILSSFCHRLCFGAECADEEALYSTAQALLSPEFKAHLRTFLDEGISFPAARQKALEAMGLQADMLTAPNNILAVEYCKAILAQESNMRPFPILRKGSYHAQEADRENPSATSVRTLMEADGSWEEFVPAEAVPYLKDATLHSLSRGERAVLNTLRTLPDEAFSALPGGSEGLWRKFMHACRKKATVEEIIDATKSKRYTRTRIDRMLLCAFLGITEDMCRAAVPYVRVLALNDRGREILKLARKSGTFLNAGEAQDDPYQLLENRCGDLYGLFAEKPEPPGAEARRRLQYLP